VSSSHAIDLPDPLFDIDALWVIKDEVVDVEFATDDGNLQSAVGANRYLAGDALITGSTGDRWCVSRDRFDAKYRPVPPTRSGSRGSYRNIPIKIRAKPMNAPFSVVRSTGGDLLRGEAGDWLVQYAPGDYGVIARHRFDLVYRVVPGG
jgi:hypothetical protein